MKVALLDAEGTPQGPESFLERDVALTRELGGVLMEHYSYKTGGRCVGNACPSCGAFVGSYYLQDYWDLVTDETGHDAGHICVDCGNHC